MKSEKKELIQANLTGERALFGSRGLRIVDSIFENGESPLKESADIELRGSVFAWKYPLWYCRNVLAEDCVWQTGARAGVWYSGDVTVRGAVIQAPKNFRRCRNLTLEKVIFSNAAETLWHCSGGKLTDVTVARGDYFGMNCTDLEIEGLTLDGNYAFDGAKDVTIRNSRLLTKDAFWNSENVTVCNSFISGEYLGWNAKNLTLIDCTVESLQGMCYIDRLKMINCKLIHTTLAFEYSTVEAEISSPVDSILNPTGGSIYAEKIGELILERDKIDPEKTVIVCRNIERTPEHPDWTGKQA